jgi:RNA polymerase sigma-70 factor (ECF subfamily)
VTILSLKPVRDYRELSDNDCMGALGGGDERGLDEIIRRYQRPLTGYLARIVNDVERARDLAQETFFRIFRHREAYRKSARFATWLYHIARNVARDELRARRRRISLTASSDGSDPETLGAECGAIPQIELREIVLRALDRLSARDRALVVLRDVEGFSYEEVAEKVGLPVGTVKSGLSRARGRLREALEEVDGLN